MERQGRRIAHRLGILGSLASLIGLGAYLYDKLQPREQPRVPLKEAVQVCTVPDIVGLDRDRAAQMVMDNGFKVRPQILLFSDTKKRGQAPPAGTAVACDSKLMMTVQRPDKGGD